MTDLIFLFLTLVNLLVFLLYYTNYKRKKEDLSQPDPPLEPKAATAVELRNDETPETKLKNILLNSLNDRASLGILMFDENGVIIGKNRSVVEILDITNDPEIVKSLPDLENMFPEIFNAERRQQKDYSNYLSYDTSQEKNEKTTFLRVNYFWHQTESGKDALAIQISDYTTYKIFENELIRSKNEAQSLNRMKSIFLANMSHEIRTPMNGIIGFSALLKEDLTEPSQLEMAERVYNSSIKLMETLEAVLDLSKLEIENYKSEKHSVDLNEIVFQVYNSFEGLVEKKQLHLSYKVPDEPVFLEIDEIILIKIIRQLLSNAIKFTHTGGILIKLEVDRHKRQEVIAISVEDTGIGISLKDQEIIFEEFRQVSEGIGRNYEGVGIGLSIVKRFCDMIDAKLSIHSAPGAGSKFTLKLKSDRVRTESSVDDPDPAEETLSEPTQYILVVEDDFTNRELIKIYLSNGYRVTVTASSREAIEALKERSFDYFLTDINLGSDMNGIQLFEYIKANCPKVPYSIAMSAYSLTNTEKECLQAGFSAFIAKPLKRKKLMEILIRAK